MAVSAASAGAVASRKGHKGRRRNPLHQYDVQDEGELEEGTDVIKILLSSIYVLSNGSLAQGIRLGV